MCQIFHIIFTVHFSPPDWGGKFWDIAVSQSAKQLPDWETWWPDRHIFHHLSTWLLLQNDWWESQVSDSSASPRVCSWFVEYHYAVSVSECVLYVYIWRDCRDRQELYRIKTSLIIQMHTWKLRTLKKKNIAS